MKSLNVERRTKNQASSVPDHACPSLITAVRPMPRRASGEGEIKCPCSFVHKEERCYASKGKAGNRVVQSEQSSPSTHSPHTVTCFARIFSMTKPDLNSLANGMSVYLTHKDYESIGDREKSKQGQANYKFPMEPNS